MLIFFSARAAEGFARQFVTDAAAMVDYRACQLEAWHGQSASWILPACQFLRNLEITVGAGFVQAGVSWDAEWVLQGKTLWRDLETSGFGLGLVWGLGFGPLTQVLGEGVAGGFAYVPASLSICEVRVNLHGNLGWHYLHRETAYAMIWATRGDLKLVARVTWIAELFGENRRPPQCQVGCRTKLIPDRLLIDLSWRGHSCRGLEGAGWAVGLAWTPPPLD